MKSLPGRTDRKYKGPEVAGRNRKVRCLDRVAQRCGWGVGVGTVEMLPGLADPEGTGSL